MKKNLKNSENLFEKQESLIKLTELQIIKELKEYNILQERSELYKDFIVNLLLYVDETYLGSDYIKPENEMEHFTWCFSKVLGEFNSENIDFKNIEEIYNYFFEFFKKSFYLSKRNDIDVDFNTMIGSFNRIFSLNSKYRLDMDTLIDIYTMFDKQLM